MGEAITKILVAGKARIMTLMSELMRLELKSSEDVDSYLVRAQEIGCNLAEAGEEVSDTLLINAV